MQAKISEYVNTTQRIQGEEAFQETEIGLIPADWKIMRLGDHLTLIRNGLTKRQNKDRIGVPVTRIETISGDKINPDKVGYLANISQEEIDKFRLREGDILFSHINSEPQLGRSVVYTGYPPMLLHGMNLLLIRAWTDRLNPYFLNYLFAHYRQKGVFIGIASRAVNQSSINQGKMKSLKFPLPSLPEQETIAKVLGTIQRAIEQQDKIIEAAKNLKKSLMRKLFTEGLGHTEFKETEIGQVPSSWSAVKFKEAISKKRFRVGKIKQREYKKSGKYPVIDQSQNFIAGFTDEDNKVYDGDLPVIIFGDHTRVFKFVDFRFVMGADGVKVILAERKLIDPLFFYFTLSNLKIQSRGYNRHYPLLREKKIPVPPFPEQQEIARILITMDKKIEVERRRKTTLNELFRTMLHKLMTGEIRLEDVEV